MPRISYVNGRYVRHGDAVVHIEDRGYQLADAVYEVCEIRGGFIIDMTRHLDRLDRSLGELRMAWPMGRKPLEQVIRNVVRKNSVTNGIVYLQVSRGVAKRDHVFPPEGTRPALVVTARRMSPAILETKLRDGIRVITVPDNRWGRVDIKTVGLLPNALARQQAKENGAAEALFVDRDGMITEGGATNVWIVTPDGTLVTRHTDHAILRGVTRTTMLDAAADLGIDVEERAFSVEEAQSSREVFLTSATGAAVPIVAIDGVPIANGHPGSIAAELRKAFLNIAERTPT